MASAPTLHEQPIEYWNGEAGERWVEANAFLDPLLAPFGEAMLETVTVASSSRALDIGCGCGATTLRLAELVGPEGSVTGVDVSGPMLAFAGNRAAERPELRIKLTLADAGRHPFDRGGFDLALSRFGLMFFEDPASAFANIRRALADDGRLAFVCWRPEEENEWLQVPRSVILRHVPPPTPPPPGAPGPFSLAVPDEVRSLLRGAGFGSVQVTRVDHSIQIPGPVEHGVGFFQQVGEASRLLREAPETVRLRALADLTEALAPFNDGTATSLLSAAWIVVADTAAV